MKKVLVLLSTYNGEKYIDEQLKSIFSQKNVEVHVLARDDGSQDRTIEILRKWEQKEKLHWYTGENLKPAKSFLNLIGEANGYDYYALSDQDDYWLPDKLETAIDLLNRNEANLYYSPTTLVNEKLEKLHQINYPKEDFDFYQSVMYNHFSGCTMVFDEKLRTAIAKKKPETIVMHDWWIILLCKAIGMRTVYGKDSKILYRQHGNNSVGLKKTWPIKYWMHCALRKNSNESDMLLELNELYEDSVIPAYSVEIKRILSAKEKIKERISICMDKHYSTHGNGCGWGKETIGFKLKILFGNL